MSAIVVVVGDATSVPQLHRDWMKRLFGVSKFRKVNANTKKLRVFASCVEILLFKKYILFGRLMCTKKKKNPSGV